MDIKFKPGDVIGFSGNHWRSAIINLLTGGIPLWSLSHVGIIGNYRNEMLVFESSEYQDSPDRIFGLKIKGVQTHCPEDIIESYNGKVWLYSLYRNLYLNEARRLNLTLLDSVGKLYDNEDVWRSGGILFSLLQAIFHKQDLRKFFCSEFVAYELSNIGIFPTCNAGRWSPNHLIRTLIKNGIVHRPVRLK